MFSVIISSQELIYSFNYVFILKLIGSDCISSHRIGTRVSLLVSVSPSQSRSRQLGHHAPEVGQRVVVGVGLRIGGGGRRPREARVVAAQWQRTRQQLGHYWVVRDQRHHWTELLRKPLQQEHTKRLVFVFLWFISCTNYAFTHFHIDSLFLSLKFRFLGVNFM